MSAIDRSENAWRDRTTITSGAAVPPHLATRQWRQLLLITVSAVAIFFGLRLLPTGTNLSHMDFRVDPKAGNVLEFCDPLNPQFIPVVAARSPVTMSIATSEPVVAGREIRAVVTLKTGSGKPVTPADLLVTHTRLLHLLVTDPSLSDYQHVHPVPTLKDGEWVFSFVPRAGGEYRVFADFTPAATRRGLYASADLNVIGPVSAATPVGGREKMLRVGDRLVASAERDGVLFTLSPAEQPVRAGRPIDLRFGMSRADGSAIALEPVMGAFAHLVAFDETRSGFAHLHPAEADLLKKPEGKSPALNFKLTIPRSGRYIIWAQVNMGGTETFVPFELAVI